MYITRLERETSRKNTLVATTAAIGLCGALALAVYGTSKEGEQRQAYAQNLAAALRADGFTAVSEAYGTDAQNKPIADVAVGACALKDVRLTYEGTGRRPFDITNYHFEAYVQPYSKPDKQLDPFISGGEITLDFRNAAELQGMVSDGCAELDPILDSRELRRAP